MVKKTFIQKIEIQCARNITHAEFHFDEGQASNFTGANGAGKSTAIDMILFLFRGARELRRLKPAKFQVSEVVQKGADKLLVTAQIQDQERTLTITRSIDAEGKATLKATADDGSKRALKSDEVESLIFSLGFNPLEIAGMTIDQQSQLAVDITGVDIAGYEKRIADLMAEKDPHDDAQNHLANKIKRQRQTIGELPDNLEKIDISDLARKKSEQDTIGIKMRAAETEERTARDALDEYRHLVEKLHSENVEIAEKLSELRAEMEQNAKKIVILNTQKIPEAEQKLQEAEAATQAQREKSLAQIDVDYDAQIREAERHNEKIRVLDEINADEAERLDEVAIIREIQQQIAGVKTELAKTLGEKLPERISFDRERGGFLFERGGHFIALSELSTAEQITAALSLCKRAMKNTPLKLFAIQNASLLDSKKLKSIIDFSRENGIALLLETVEQEIEGTQVFRMEAGELKESPPEKTL